MIVDFCSRDCNFVGRRLTVDRTVHGTQTSTVVIASRVRSCYSRGILQEGITGLFARRFTYDGYGDSSSFSNSLWSVMIC